MRDKEAVSAEISRLIGTPVRETSRGGTVKRPFLEDVAAVLGVASTGHSKVELAREVVVHLGQVWDDDCASEHTVSGGGGNVTRTALERILDGLRAQPTLWTGPADAAISELAPEPSASDLAWRAGLDEIAATLEAAGHLDVDSLEDERWRTLSAIVQRRGQPAFRRRLLRAYGGQCAITGCDAPAALEAAHIVPYLGGSTNVVTNGLLLRADVHTLFDLGLIGIRASDRVVVLDDQLVGTVYDPLAGRRLTPPRRTADAPGDAVLAWRAANVGPAAARA